MRPDTVNVMMNYRFVAPDYRHPDGGAWWPINAPEVVAATARRIAQAAEALTLIAVQCTQAGHTHFHAGGVQCTPQTRRCEARAQVARSETQTTTRTLLIKEFLGWFDPPAAGATTGADRGSPG
jgi:hypothetical protein